MHLDHSRRVRHGRLDLQRRSGKEHRVRVSPGVARIVVVDLNLFVAASYYFLRCASKENERTELERGVQFRQTFSHPL